MSSAILCLLWGDIFHPSLFICWLNFNSKLVEPGTRVKWVLSSLYKYCHCVLWPQQTCYVLAEELEESMVKLAKIHHQQDKRCALCRKEDVQGYHLGRTILSTYLLCITHSQPIPIFCFMQFVFLFWSTVFSSLICPSYVDFEVCLYRYSLLSSFSSSLVVNTKFYAESLMKMLSNRNKVIST